MLRICWNALGRPKLGRPNWSRLLMLVTQLVMTTWFRTLLASKRRSALRRSLMRNVRANDALRTNVRGPVIELRPALPNFPVPVAGHGDTKAQPAATNAAGLRKRPFGAA